MARRTKEEADATRERVLLAALDLFGEKGYSRTTFSDIAKRIQMTRGAVYWHFENKPALLAALVEFAFDRKRRLVDEQISHVETLEDLRNTFVMYARVVAEDTLTRKFEFFMNFQMEWSQELLTETHKKMNEIRQSPLEEFKHCFEEPQVAERLREGTDLDQLVITLAAFWSGACNLFFGGCPFIDAVTSVDGELEGRTVFNLVETAEQGFDLILKGVLKEESGNE